MMYVWYIWIQFLEILSSLAVNVPVSPTAKEYSIVSFLFPSFLNYSDSWQSRRLRLK